MDLEKNKRALAVMREDRLKFLNKMHPVSIIQTKAIGCCILSPKKQQIMATEKYEGPFRANCDLLDELEKWDSGGIFLYHALKELPDSKGHQELAGILDKAMTMRPTLQYDTPINRRRTERPLHMSIPMEETSEAANNIPQINMLQDRMSLNETRVKTSILLDGNHLTELPSTQCARDNPKIIDDNIDNIKNNRGSSKTSFADINRNKNHGSKDKVDKSKEMQPLLNDNTMNEPRMECSVMSLNSEMMSSSFVLPMSDTDVHSEQRFQTAFRENQHDTRGLYEIEDLKCHITQSESHSPTPKPCPVTERSCGVYNRFEIDVSSGKIIENTPVQGALNKDGNAPLIGDDTDDDNTRVKGAQTKVDFTYLAGTTIKFDNTPVQEGQNKIDSTSLSSSPTKVDTAQEFENLKHPVAISEIPSPMHTTSDGVNNWIENYSCTEIKGNKHVQTKVCNTLLPEIQIKVDNASVQEAQNKVDSTPVPVTQIEGENTLLKGAQTKVDNIPLSGLQTKINNTPLTGVEIDVSKVPVQGTEIEEDSTAGQGFQTLIDITLLPGAETQVENTPLSEAETKVDNTLSQGVQTRYNRVHLKLPVTVSESASPNLAPCLATGGSDGVNDRGEINIYPEIQSNTGVEIKVDNSLLQGIPTELINTPPRVGPKVDSTTVPRTQTNDNMPIQGAETNVAESKVDYTLLPRAKTKLDTIPVQIAPTSRVASIHGLGAPAKMDNTVIPGTQVKSDKMPIPHGETKVDNISLTDTETHINTSTGDYNENDNILVISNANSSADHLNNASLNPNINICIQNEDEDAAVESLTDNSRQNTTSIIFSRFQSNLLSNLNFTSLSPPAPASGNWAQSDDHSNQALLSHLNRSQSLTGRLLVRCIPHVIKGLSGDYL